MEVTLTDAGTIWSDTGPSTIYEVKVKTAAGTATVAAGDTGYIELQTTENSLPVKRFYTVDATGAQVQYTTTATIIGSFFTENAPTNERAILYNATFSTT